MLKKCFFLLKKVIISMIMIYSFDVFAVSLNLSIPINLITVLLVSLFEVPALMCLVLFSMTF